MSRAAVASGSRIIQGKMRRLTAQHQALRSRALFRPGGGDQPARRCQIQIGRLFQKLVCPLEFAPLDRFPFGVSHFGDGGIVREQAFPARQQTEILVGLFFQTPLQLGRVVRNVVLGIEAAQDSLEDGDRDTLFRFEAAQQAVQLVLHPRDASRGLDCQLRQQVLAPLRIGQDGPIGSFDEAPAELPQALVDSSGGEAVMGETDGGCVEYILGDLGAPLVPPRADLVKRSRFRTDFRTADIQVKQKWRKPGTA